MNHRRLIYISIATLWCLPSGYISTGDIGSWGQWTNVDSCSTTCGEGRQIRTRICNMPIEGVSGCIGPENDTISCNNGHCPDINSSWSQWSNFSSCSVSCGDGVMTRNRTCKTLSANDSASCNGSDTESVSCKDGDCAPINGGWGAWSNYSECSLTCGNGSQSRIRNCDDPAPEYGGLYCEGQYIETRPCNEFDCPGMDNKGKVFILGFIPNLDQPELKVFITTENEQTVHVNITTPLFDKAFKSSTTVRKGDVKKITLDSALQGTAGVIENNGFHIVADEDIVVYVINKATYTTDAFLAIPVDTLGQDYYVISWNERSSFLIIASEDGTDVHIKCGPASGSIILDGKPCSPGLSVTVNLDKFQTLLGADMSYGVDFTGTHIYADKPVSVLGGSICARIGAGACDHMFQQILPIEKWGKDFVTIGMPNCQSEDTYRIIASQDNTVVNISGFPSQALAKAGDFYTFNIKEKLSKTVTSNKGIALVLYAHGGCDGSGMGDPAMILIPPIQHFASDYTFSTVSLEHNDFINSLSVVIAEDYISGLRFDGNILPATTWKAAEDRDDIKHTSFTITSGAHSIYHIDPSVTFLAVSTGIQSYNSYGYPTGFKFPSTTNCTDTSSGKKETDVCGFSLDPCKDQPCLNGGTCFARGWTNFECVCPKTFGGPTCRSDLCTPLPSDVVFVIDGSKSMGHHFFEIQKQFIEDLTRNWTIGEEHFQVAIVSFSSTAKIEHNFDVILDVTDLHNKLSMLQLYDQSSRIDIGVSTGETLLNQRQRQVDYINVEKIMIVITDGLASSPRDIKSVTSNDITTYVVALGEDVSHYYLSKIAGNAAFVFPPKSERLLNVMMSKLIHPICEVCYSSNKTDLIVMVDISRDMDNDDMITHVPSVTNKLLSKIDVNHSGTRISLVTFDNDIDVIFKSKQYTSATQYRVQQDMSAFYQTTNKVDNLTDVLLPVNDMLESDTIESAQTILLIISNFRFQIDDNSKEELANACDNFTEVFTIGLDTEEESFSNMLRLASSSFHVGTVGHMFANEIDTFISSFVEQLSYTKCSF